MYPQVCGGLTAADEELITRRTLPPAEKHPVLIRRAIRTGYLGRVVNYSRVLQLAMVQAGPAAALG